ncbi:MAG: M56 family metallopeptidase [Chloroflexota bacterium]
MTDLLVELAISNLLISAAMAVAAYAVHRRGRYPRLAHLLWVLVLVKAITPPLLTLPIIPGFGFGSAALGELAIGSQAGSGTFAVGGAATTLAFPESIAASIAASGVTVLLLLWAAGSMFVLAASLFHIYRFDRLLRRTSVKAPAHLQGVAAGIASELGLGSTPVIYTSLARLSPMTWWVGRHVSVVIPAALEGAIEPSQMRWVLGHELAHIKRRDYLVRWLEWLACVMFWWNPVVWWSRGNLRVAEEVSCDALVLDRLGAQPRSYAGALLKVMEFLAGSPTRPPAVATGLGAGDSLERRFMTIVSGSRTREAPRWLAVGLTSAALVVMTVGVSSAAGLEDAQRPAAALQGIASQPVAAPGLPEYPDPATIEDAELPAEFADPSGAPIVPRAGEATAYLSAEIGGALPQGKLAAEIRPAKRARRWDNVFVGTPGADSYDGSDGRDKIVGRAGADELSGGGRGDLIRGGKGADTIRGDAGPDRLIGGPGNDIIFGGGRGDLIRGGGGNDTIRAGAGNDIVKTWRDGVADTVDCGPGDKDRAIADSTDSLVNCEFIVVRDPS